MAGVSVSAPGGCPSKMSGKMLTAIFRIPYVPVYLVTDPTPTHLPSRPGLTNTSIAVILTCWHLVFATIATQVLARTTNLLDGRKNVKMTGRTYLRAIVPIGLLYSASLVCSNMVYLYLSVAFIQMLKAAAPVAVLLTSWAWGVEDPSLKRFLNVLLIVAGVALASLGEIDFSLAGFMFQVGGIVFEAMRLVMIQVLLSGDTQKMDPLVSLYYYAPVCAVMNFIIAVVYEADSFNPADLAQAGYGLLLLNAMVAFMLNVSSVFLVSPNLPLFLTPPLFTPPLFLPPPQAPF